MTESETLFSQILGCDRLSLYLHKDSYLKDCDLARIISVLESRINGLPLQYILGKTEFFGLDFMVNENVFIPRPETEILVETAIKIVRSSEFGVRNILDLGTGSGCIAVSLAKFLPETHITATDISLEAIEIAKQNALINNVRINFLLSDLFTNSKLRTPNSELIISNPPYIATGEIGTLQPEVKNEPKIALDGGSDGLDFYRKIINQAPDYLKSGGLLIMEMGFNQCERIENVFKNSGIFKIIEVVKDYSGIDRVIVAKKFKNLDNFS